MNSTLVTYFKSKSTPSGYQLCSRLQAGREHRLSLHVGANANPLCDLYRLWSSAAPKTAAAARCPAKRTIGRSEIGWHSIRSSRFLMKPFSLDFLSSTTCVCRTRRPRLMLHCDGAKTNHVFGHTYCRLSCCQAMSRVVPRFLLQTSLFLSCSSGPSRLEFVFPARVDRCTPKVFGTR